MSEVATVAVFLITIAGIVFFANKFPEWIVATAGAMLLILTGLEPLRRAALSLAAQSQILLFFAGLTFIVAALEEARFFQGLILWLARLSDGSSRRLFWLLTSLAVLVTVFLTNDSCALVLTPLVAGIVTQLHLPKLPFVLTLAFIANAASTIFPFSNPTNLIVAHAMALHLSAYLGLVLVPGLFALAATVGILAILYAPKLSHRFIAPDFVKNDTPTWRFSFTVCVVVASLILASALGWPIGTVTLFGGAALIIATALDGQSMRAVISRAHVSTVVLVAALFLIVDAVRGQGLMRYPLLAFSRLIHGQDHWVAPLTETFSALASNVFNNLPTSMLTVAMLNHHLLSPTQSGAFAAGSILGLAIGPNLTPAASLSTLLIIILLRKRGIVISPQDYIMPGAFVAISGLVAGAIGFLVLSVLGH